MPRLRIVARNARQAAVNHEPHAVNRDAGFGDVRGDDDLGLVVTRDGGVLIARRKFAVQRQHEVAARRRRVPNGFNGLRNLEAAGHEHQHIALAARVDETG